MAGDLPSLNTDLSPEPLWCVVYANLHHSWVIDPEPDRVVALGFWKTKEDAEQYHRAEYQKVHETLRHLLEAEPVIRTFDVHTSTSHKIAAGKAAGSRG